MHEPLFPCLGSSASTQAALVFPERTLSYAELTRAAAAVAASVAGAKRIAVMAEPRIETAVAVIGGLMAAVPVAVINPQAGAAELAHVMQDAAPDLVFGGEDLTVDLDARPPSGQSWPEPSPEQPGLVVYTSGTTGPPKGAVLPRRAIASNIDALARAWDWTAVDTVVHGLPLFHVHGLVLGVLGPVRLGGTVRHLGRFSTDSVAAALREGASMLFGVPTMYRRLADAAGSSPELSAALASARLLVSGSAPLPSAEHQRLKRVTGRRVLERYGMTETLMNTAMTVDGTESAGYVGPPLDNVELRLVDDAGVPLTVSDDETIGEIEIRGPNLFLGYLNRPDATDAVMRAGWFRTGDLATRRADGYVRIVGRRATDLIKSGGYKIGAGEVEAALREHPAVDDAAVVGEPDEDLGERVAAWVVLRPGLEADGQELTDHVAAQLAPHKRPRRVEFIEELPRNAMGKVQKKLLPRGAGR